MAKITRDEILKAIRQNYTQPEQRVQPVVVPKISPEAAKAFREGRGRHTA